MMKSNMFPITHQKKLDEASLEHFQALTMITKSSILDVRLGSEYTSVLAETLPALLCGFESFIKFFETPQWMKC